LSGINVYHYGNNLICICLDTNECELKSGHNCSQNCNNLPGGYTCMCNDGYHIAADKMSCDG